MDNYKKPLVTKKQPKLTEQIIITPEEVSIPPLIKPKKIKNGYKQKLLTQYELKAKNSIILNLILLFSFVGFLIFFIMNCKENQIFSSVEPAPYERLLLV